MKIGAIVQLKHPLNEPEKHARYVLLDDPNIVGQRVDIQSICNLPFPPIERVSINEIEYATLDCPHSDN